MRLAPILLAAMLAAGGLGGSAGAAAVDPQLGNGDVGLRLEEHLSDHLTGICRKLLGDYVCGLVGL